MSKDLNVLEIELHDSLIKEMHLNFDKKTALLQVDFYRDESEKVRRPLRVEFFDVESISGLCDLKTLSKNAFAGNVNYWLPGDTTYIYLTDGCISIKAGSIRCQELQIRVGD